jgi:hypothetical protein
VEASTWVRIAAAAVCVLIYHRIYTPDWRNPALLLYDVPTIALAGSFAAGSLSSLADSPARGFVYLAAVTLALLAGWGAGYRQWPLSGHLTVAITAGGLEAANTANMPWFRLAALVPSTVLICIRTLWPQFPLMGNHGNTITGCLAGMAIVALALGTNKG